MCFQFSLKNKINISIFKIKKMLSIKELIKANIHLGQKTNKWNPRTSYYLFGIKDNIHILDIEQSIIMLRRAMIFIKKISEKRGNITYIPHISGDRRGALAEVLTHVPKSSYKNLAAFYEDKSKKKDKVNTHKLSLESSSKNYKFYSLQGFSKKKNFLNKDNHLSETKSSNDIRTKNKKNLAVKFSLETNVEKSNVFV